jgi:hypothetical protein
MQPASIPGYAYGDPSLPPAPLSLAEFELLKKTVTFTEDDVQALRLAGAVLADQVEEILDVWYGFVGSQPHLLAYFSDPQGRPIPEYLAAVRRRFGQWILDTCQRPYDQDWLAYQFEIGRRHHRLKKNQTDGVQAAPHIPLRYVLTLLYPIVATIRPFLARKGHPPEAVERMHQAWFKAVLLQVTLWAYPYTHAGDF